MIEVSIKEKDGEILSITMDGHAQSDEPGRDLVCAGASCVFSGAVYALEGRNITENHKKGHAEIAVHGPVSTYDRYVLEVLKKQLIFLGNEEKQYVRVHIEELRKE
jgi:uncharacterized protein YsxB (DUF464 family)